MQNALTNLQRLTILQLTKTKLAQLDFKMHACHDVLGKSLSVPARVLGGGIEMSNSIHIT